MKLICLYIENFGGLKQVSMEFDGGITTVCQANGFGKTTLAEFIRAMFYGFPRKTKALEKSRRQKYLPWNGGICGGNLTFEHEGNRYRIERTFGEVPKEDTFTLIDLAVNKRTARYSEQIGQELFGLDADSFERSVYLPQMYDDTALSTASIQAKLTALVEDSSDVANFDKAIAALRSKRSALIPFRGSGGSVAEAGAAISRLQIQLDQALQQETQLETARTEEDTLRAKTIQAQAELERLRLQLAEASEMAAIAVRQQQYEQLRTRYRDAASLAGQLEAQYPKGLPEEQEICDAEKTADRLAVLEAQRTGRKEIRFPSEQQINACREKYEQWDALQMKIPDLQSRLTELELSHRSTAAMGWGMRIVTILAGIICISGWLLGTAAMILREQLWGYIGLGAGTAGALTTIILLLIHWSRHREKKKAQNEERQALREELAKLIEADEQYRRQIRQFLYPYFGETEPRRFLACMTRLEHDMQLQEQNRLQDSEAAACTAKLEQFFARFGLTMDDDARILLRKLREQAQRMQTAAAQRQELARQLSEFRREFAQALSSQVLPVADVRQLRTEEQRLQDHIKALTAQLLKVRQNIHRLHTQVEQIPQLRQELAALQKRQAKQREDVRILDVTMEYLHQARENLSTAYLGTIRARFDYYLARLEGSGADRYMIDTDLQVRLERLGQTRELAYFSAGQVDLLMLCMRLALVDALFGEEKMFVILDDPFINLDDVHLSQAKGLLRQLATGRQIIYLTCHRSRMM